MSKAQGIVEENKMMVLYEDERTIAALSDKPKAKGHILIFSKEDYEHIDDVPEDMISHFFYVASFAATSIYELLGGGQDLGTNIIVNEGNGSNRRFEQFYIDVIPRKAEDGINYRWEPKPGNQQELAEVEKKIKDETFFIGGDSSSSTSSGSSSPVSNAPKPQKIESDGDNYMIKQLDRIP